MYGKPFARIAHIRRKMGENMAAYRVNLQKLRCLPTKSCKLGGHYLTPSVQITFSALKTCVSKFKKKVLCSSRAYTSSSELQLPLTPVDIMVVDF
jgi:hypothetical protein